MAIWPDTVRNWGTTDAERSRSFPCDRLLPEPNEALYRAVDVDAPAATVFLWLCQLRLAPYSYDRIDNFGRPSPRRLVPGLDRLEAGQVFMRIFELVDFEPGRSITLESNKPRSVRSVVSYLAEDRGGDRSRLLVKYSVGYGSAWLAAPMKLILPPGDLLMMRRQLLNLKQLAEAT
jgi:hypothetical protein